MGIRKSGYVQQNVLSRSRTMLTSKQHWCCRDYVMMYAYVKFHHNKSLHMISEKLSSTQWVNIVDVNDAANTNDDAGN